MEQIGDNPCLPEDIIRTILKRLPVKSLIRFHCVCKDWKNLLKTPSFITEHLHHSMNENPLLLLQWGHKLDPLHFHILNHKMQLLEVQPPSPLMDSSFRTEIVGCSNGLLCATSHNSPPSISVWNPATREILQVPGPIKFENEFVALGFGFSPIDNDYKILVSDERADIGRLRNTLEVYSLNTGSWKEIKVEEFGGLTICEFPATVNGAMFWFGYKVMNVDENYFFVSDMVCVVVSFDMVMEVFTLIPLPCDDDDSWESFLSVYENKLAMLCGHVSENNESYRTDLWVMEEGALSSGERWSWSKKYSISTSSSIYPLGIWLDVIVYLFIGSPTYDELESETNHRTSNVLYTLNLSTHEWVEFNCGQRGSQFWPTFDYAESLMPIANIHPCS
ncbi:hypothetical protein QN277_005746 [Acacia crassicarpa]|uniref:F-box domain-containing protein n=1 Tax=Acacia crassicarpa TaxID=499986 RepID=A0AAE1IYM7_9FABA|nr:hypothetical protein QN277_005746 [Acacia crassicarpa]